MNEPKQRAETIAREMNNRIFKLGLRCDKIPSLFSGFCPEGHGPRDNITRIKLAFDYFEKRLAALERDRERLSQIVSIVERPDYTNPEEMVRQIRAAIAAGKENVE